MKNKTIKLTERNYDIISDALEQYVVGDKYSGIFSEDEVEETFYKVQDLWEKAIQERDEKIS